MIVKRRRAFFYRCTKIFYTQGWRDSKMGLCLLQLAIFLEQYFSHRHLLSFIQSLVTFVQPAIHSIKWKIYYLLCSIEFLVFQKRLGTFLSVLLEHCLNLFITVPKSLLELSVKYTCNLCPPSQRARCRWFFEVVDGW